MKSIYFNSLANLIGLASLCSSSISFAATQLWYPSSSGNHYVYVESNIPQAGSNSILAYQALADGSLNPLPGSPFLTGGSGFTDPSFSLGPFDSDQILTTNPERTLLFAVNGGSNSIAVFHIQNNGALVPVDGSPFSSYGIQPASVGYADGKLVVVNKHQDPAQASDQTLPNYTVFQVNPNGSLTHISDSTVSVANGSSPSQALEVGSLIFGADFLGGLLQSFQLAGGLLHPHAPVSLPDSEFQGVSAPHAPLGLEVNPNQPVLYVGFPTASKLGVYTFEKNGKLHFLRTAANSGQAICWLKSDANGARLYTSNSADHSVSVYDTSTPSNPREIQKLTLDAVGATFQLAINQNQSLIYVIEQAASATVSEVSATAIHVIQITPHRGAISELTDKKTLLSLPLGTRPQGVLVI